MNGDYSSQLGDGSGQNMSGYPPAAAPPKKGGSSPSGREVAGLDPALSKPASKSEKIFAESSYASPFPAAAPAEREPKERSLVSSFSPSEGNWKPFDRGGSTNKSRQLWAGEARKISLELPSPPGEIGAMEEGEGALFTHMESEPSQLASPFGEIDPEKRSSSEPSSSSSSSASWSKEKAYGKGKREGKNTKDRKDSLEKTASSLSKVAEKTGSGIGAGLSSVLSLGYRFLDERRASKQARMAAERWMESGAGEEYLTPEAFKVFQEYGFDKSDDFINVITFSKIAGEELNINTFTRQSEKYFGKKVTNREELVDFFHKMCKLSGDFYHFDFIRIPRKKLSAKEEFKREKINDDEEVTFTKELLGEVGRYKSVTVGGVRLEQFLTKGDPVAAGEKMMDEIRTHAKAMELPRCGDKKFIDKVLQQLGYGDDAFIASHPFTGDVAQLVQSRKGKTFGIEAVRVGIERDGDAIVVTKRIEMWEKVAEGKLEEGGAEKKEGTHLLDLVVRICVNPANSTIFTTREWENPGSLSQF